MRTPLRVFCSLFIAGCVAKSTVHQDDPADDPADDDTDVDTDTDADTDADVDTDIDTDVDTDADLTDTAVGSNPRGELARLCRDMPQELSSRGFLLPEALSGAGGLFDADGHVVNEWASTGLSSGLSWHLYSDGSLLRALSPWPRDVGAPLPMGGGGGLLVRHSWDGDELWRYSAYSDTVRQHHGMEVLPNGNILVVLAELHTVEEATSAGFDPQWLQEPGLLVEAIEEIAPTANGGDVVWRWDSWDHIGKGPEAFDPAARNAQGDWLHVNSIDYNAAFDEIVISARTTSEVYILDHSTTTAEARTTRGGRSDRGGSILWRWGNPSNYGAGTSSDKLLFEQHDAQWIPNGRRGAGDILVYNNGNSRPGGDRSSVDQITPPRQPDGSYAMRDGRFLPEALTVSQFVDVGNGAPYFAGFMSGAQRLPDGRTLVGTAFGDVAIQDEGGVASAVNIDNNGLMFRVRSFDLCSPGALAGITPAQ